MALRRIQDYYGQVLQGADDLKTSACCDLAPPPPHIRAALARVHHAVSARYYGCGLIAPERLEGMTVLDLGCGAGRDAFVLAQLVGETGQVIGLDVTPEQLAVARAHEAGHAAAFGYAAPNTRFVEGRIEQLSASGIAPGSIDVIVSNCVINLCEDKGAVLGEVWRALKPGGEFYFSDVYADRRLPAALMDDPVLHGECLAGALYWRDFLALAKAAGFGDPRLTTARPIAVTDDSVRGKLGAARFFSATNRLFKLDALEPACEDYGQAVIYRGDIAHAPEAFDLDGHHHIETGKVFALCGNSWRMLAETRFAPHFQFIGDFSRHYGAFEGCGPSLPAGAIEVAGAATQACC